MEASVLNNHQVLEYFLKHNEMRCPKTFSYLKYYSEQMKIKRMIEEYN